MKRKITFEIELESLNDLHPDEAYPMHWMVENPKQVFDMAEMILGRYFNEKELIRYVRLCKNEIDEGISQMLADRDYDQQAEE
jgi:hypothetical protein